MQALDSGVISHIGSFLDLSDRIACYEASKIFHSVHWAYGSHQVKVGCHDGTNMMNRILAILKIKPYVNKVYLVFCCDDACKAIDIDMLHALAMLKDCHFTFKDSCTPCGVNHCLKRVHTYKTQNGNSVKYHLHAAMRRPFDMELVSGMSSATIVCNDALSFRSILACPYMQDVLVRLVVDRHEEIEPVEKMAFLPGKRTMMQANLTGIIPGNKTRDVFTSNVTMLALQPGYWNNVCNVRIDNVYPMVDHIYIAWDVLPSLLPPNIIWYTFLRNMPACVKKVSIKVNPHRPFDTFARLDSLLNKHKHLSLKLVMHDRASLMHAIVIREALHALHPCTRIHISNKSMVKTHSYCPVDIGFTSLKMLYAMVEEWPDLNVFARLVHRHGIQT